MSTVQEGITVPVGEADLTYVAEIEHRTLPAVVWMSSAGVPVDADGWREHARKTEADAARLKDELNALAPEHPDGKAWNFSSHQQVRKAAELLGVDLPNTKDETLALYAKEHQFISALRDYRKAAKLASTYGAGWLENGYHQDGRIYASWRQLRAATGRMACGHPNLQNIPRTGYRMPCDALPTIRSETECQEQSTSTTGRPPTVRRSPSSLRRPGFPTTWHR